MTTFQERLLKVASPATAIFAVVMLVHGAVLSAENGGCTNNTCKDINIVRFCAGNDSVWQLIDCIFCKTSGRCDTGAVNSRRCPCGGTKQKFKLISTTIICDCANAPAADSTVERTGSYSNDNWTNSTSTQCLCGGSS